MMDMKSYMAEFIGTFALVFIGAGVVMLNGLTNGAILGITAIAFAHGLVLMSMIYALSHISGAHFNPAVTIAMLAVNRIKLMPAVLYIIAQLAGAVFASFLLLFIFNQLPLQTEIPPALIYGFSTSLSFQVGIPLEAVLTFFLVLTIFGTTVDSRATKGIHGFAIGLVLTFDILFAGAITGGAMNPARAFGPAVTSGIWNTQAIYWLGPIIGALIAGLVYEYLFLEREKTKKK